MGKVLVANHVTLDGVTQSPARPGEDTRAGFAHGGWASAVTTSTGVLIASYVPQ
jgi:hypothetical protein